MKKSIKLLLVLGSILGTTQAHAQRKLSQGLSYFIYDNGPDYVENGMQRIIKGEKIGYINARSGRITVAPQYKCAEPFKNGRAEVSYNCTISAKDSEGHSSWCGGEWFFIDKKGRRLYDSKK